MLLLEFAVAVASAVRVRGYCEDWQMMRASSGEKCWSCYSFRKRKGRAKKKKY
jgi:hypothetical protein